jgi:N-acetylglucosaminyldiphosphoundecaprenol N-acetyl-beta-D-mannosaminyltransferase
VKILNVKITTDSKQKILQKVTTVISSKHKFVIFTPNPEIVELASQNISVGVYHGKPLPFRELLNTADVNLPDGIGLKIACDLKNFFLKNFSDSPSSDVCLPSSVFRPPDVTHGLDFMLDLCQMAEKEGYSIGLLGGMDNAAEKTKDALINRHPKLKIDYIYGDFNFSVGAHHGVPDPTESREPRVQHAEPLQQNTQPIPQPSTHLDLLFVAMGTPKEQLWIAQNKDSFPATVFMEVGGSFDIISGRLKRAPRLMQRLGLEWLFRLIQEPRRIKRQINIFKFLLRVLTTKNSVER